MCLLLVAYDKVFVYEMSLWQGAVVSEASFPGPGPDGEQPPPGDPARDEAASPPPVGACDAAPPRPDDDWDGDAEMAAYIADLDAGRARIPEEWEIEGPAATIGLGDAADVDLVELAAMVGPDGLGGEVFAQDRSADVMRPGPVLAALTEQAAGGLDRLTDNQVLGAMSAARRLAARAAWLELTAVAEFTRRREAQYEDAKARGVPRGCRDGEFPDAELGMELVTSQNAARDQMDLAGDLETRLPRTRAALAAGVIDADRARLIWRPTRHLTDADAARADEILAVLAPGLRYDQLARKAVAVAMKLDPGAFTRGKEQARADRQRVQAGREESGNAFLSGRELAIEDALASKAHIDALAVALRRGGLPGTLQRLRVLAFNDLTQGRDPLDRLTGPEPADDAGRHSHRASRHAAGSPAATRAQGTAAAAAAARARCPATTLATTRALGRLPGRRPRQHDAGDGDDDASWDGCPDMTEWQHERRGTTEDDDHHGQPRRPARAPPRAVPGADQPHRPGRHRLRLVHRPRRGRRLGTDRPRRHPPPAAGRLHASPHPLVHHPPRPDGTAVAHGCARGPHPWIPPPDSGGTRDGPDARQAAALADLLRDLNVTFTPIAKGTCDHAGREDRYTPSRKLRHLVRTRTATCTAPGCGAQAVHCDLDHTLAYPAGITCQCDLAPACRRHHR